LHVLEHASYAGRLMPVDPVDWSLRKVEAEAYLERVAERVHAADVAAETFLQEGMAAERITEFARSQNSDLIVLSSHGQSGMSAWDLSSVVNKVLHRFHGSIMVVRAYHPPSEDLAAIRYMRILVPLDGSQRAEHALPVASALIRYYGGRLRIAHIVPRPQMPRRTPPNAEDQEMESRLIERNSEEAKRYLSQLQEQIGADIDAEVFQNAHVAGRLHELSDERELELIVLTAHGESGQTKWRYGSIAASLIAYSSVPLLVIQDLTPEQIEPTRAELASRQHKGH
jgi:nucleotide-binding universal stress UspA family protein